MSRRKCTCAYCGCTVWYEYQRPHLCIDCARLVRGEYRDRYHAPYARHAPHAPACGCDECRVERAGVLGLDDDGSLIDLAEIVREEVRRD